MPQWSSVTEIEAALLESGYLPDRGLATAIFLAADMRRPLLLEGEPGVGKTQVAVALARICNAELIRLQCYEGIDATQALYEWQYMRQILALRNSQQSGGSAEAIDLYGAQFLAERPILRAVKLGERAVLLIDELDRADDQFEALLLETLSDFAITIPEVGTIRAATAPTVVITSNRTRELHDALKRRCLYHWIDYPTLEREIEIIRINAPEVSKRLAATVSKAIARLRDLPLTKPPGAAEAIDWARGAARLGRTELDRETAASTIGLATKNREDLELTRERLADILGD